MALQVPSSHPTADPNNVQCVPRAEKKPNTETFCFSIFFSFTFEIIIFSYSERKNIFLFTIKLESRWRNIKNRKSNCDCATEFWKLRNGSREVFSCGEKIDIFPETQEAHRAGSYMGVFERLHRSGGLQNKRLERRIASVGPGDDVKENLCLLCRGKFASL